MSGIFHDGHWYGNTDMVCKRCGSPVYHDWRFFCQGGFCEGLEIILQGRFTERREDLVKERSGAMVYICSKQAKIDRLWGIFIKHILQMEAAGISVEYVRKGEVVLNGKRYEPVYFENTMRYEPIDSRREGKVVLAGHDIQPLIEYLKTADTGK